MQSLSTDGEEGRGRSDVWHPRRYEVDETFPAGDIFPTGKKTSFYGAVIVQTGADRRVERMEWGVPTQVPSKRDPAVKLAKYVTNVRNLSSSF